MQAFPWPGKSAGSKQAHAHIRIVLESLPGAERAWQMERGVVPIATQVNGDVDHTKPDARVALMPECIVRRVLDGHLASQPAIGSSS